MFSWSCDSSNTIHTLLIAETSDTEIKMAVEASAGKIIGLLADNILDDSLYLLFEWDPANAVLTASVTDADKKQDSPQHIRCEFSGIKANFERLDAAQRIEQQVDLTECVKFWLHDYLTTCTAFFKFSLVAIFHADSRSNTELL